MKLPWKKVELDDKSGHWLEARIPQLQWTYIVEEDTEKEGFQCYLFLNNHCSEPASIHARPLKSLKSAKAACQNHLVKTYRILKNFIP